MLKRFSMLLALVLLFTGALMAAAHEGMDHSITTPTDAFTPAAHPKYPVDSQVIIQADHMGGMQGARGTVSGAFDTVLYAIDYVHKDTGEAITHHKWVVQEEIAEHEHAHEPFKIGDTVTLLPGHITGMGGEGQQATIVEVVPGVAYMVDYEPTDGTEPIHNHQWVSEEELLPFGTLQGSSGCD